MILCATSSAAERALGGLRTITAEYSGDGDHGARVSDALEVRDKYHLFIPSVYK